MLGSAADAEDVLQDTWLRWADLGADAHAQVRDQRAYLVRITTRLALNRMRTNARRRESYVGPWLPEPLLTTPDVAEDVELADSVSTAMLVVLDTLPPDRARGLRAARGLRRRVRRDRGRRGQVAGRRAPDRAPGPRARRRAPPARTAGDARASAQEVVARFLGATATGDLQSLMDVLAPDVVLLTDGGGVKKAALRPILGRDKVVRFLDAVAPEQGLDAAVVEVNGAPAFRITVDGELDAVGSLLVEDGLVTGIYFVRNPAKLARLDEAVALTR